MHHLLAFTRVAPPGYSSHYAQESSASTPLGVQDDPIDNYHEAYFTCHMACTHPVQSLH